MVSCHPDGGFIRTEMEENPTPIDSPRIAAKM